MSPEEITAEIAAVVEEVAGVEASKVVPSASFLDDLDIDSLTMVEVVVAAEEKFGIRIPDSDIEGLSTVADVVDYVQKAQSATAGA
jgi:acyl carrier protein